MYSISILSICYSTSKMHLSGAPSSFLLQTVIYISSWIYKYITQADSFILLSLFGLKL